MKQPRELTKEEIFEYHGLTVGELKKFLTKNNLPDDAPVIVQRVEDVYFNENHWGVYLKEGESTWNLRLYEASHKDEVSPLTEDEIKQSMEQYHPAFACAKYPDDNDILFIDLHY